MVVNGESYRLGVKKMSRTNVPSQQGTGLLGGCGVGADPLNS
jgi:hypothetical protein